MYKIMGVYWSPKPEDVEEFERYYMEIHAPIGAKLPELERIVLVRFSVSLGGGEPELFRGAEMFFKDEAAYERAKASQEWTDMVEDAKIMTERYDSKLVSSAGWEEDFPVGAAAPEPAELPDWAKETLRAIRA